MMINIHSTRLSIDTNGPGRRIVIWTQGCTLNCSGCFNLIQHPHKPMNILKVDELTDFLIQKLKQYDCEGITFSGGEPFQQAKTVLKLCENIKERGYSIVIFSGYTMQELSSQTNLFVDKLFKLPDILILGRFQLKNHNINRTWFNNPDKEVIFNTPRYMDQQFDEIPNLEISIQKEELLITGFPKSLELRLLKKYLEQEGIVLEINKPN